MKVTLEVLFQVDGDGRHVYRWALKDAGGREVQHGQRPCCVADRADGTSTHQPLRLELNLGDPPARPTFGLPPIR
jgi:hypothetical protein